MLNGTKTLYHQLGQFYADLDEKNTPNTRPKCKSDAMENAKNNKLFLKDLPVYETSRHDAEADLYPRQEGRRHAGGVPAGDCEVHPRRAQHIAQGPEGFPGSSWACDGVY